MSRAAEVVGLDHAERAGFELQGHDGELLALVAVHVQDSVDPADRPE
jgi:hypothetical protein